MAKWIIFEDSVNDQHAYPIQNINAAFVTSSTNITVYARNPTQPTESVSDDTIALTCSTDTVDDVLDLLLQQFSTGNNASTISAARISEITTVAYTAGA